MDKEFSEIDFKDKRIKDRFLKTVKLLGQNPQGSINQSISNKAEKKGAYRLFSNASFDPLLVAKAHREKTKQRMAEHPVVLCLSDTTTIGHAGKDSIKGLGSIGGKIKRDETDAQDGFFFHACLGVTPKGIPLGIQSFRCWSRGHLEHQEYKESEKWRDGFDESLECYGDKTQLIYVADREGDQFKLMKHILESEKDFVIRAKSTRKIHGKNYYLKTEIEQNDILHKDESLDFEMKFGAIGFNDPSSKGPSNLKRKDIDCIEINYVHVKLADAEWILYTSLELKNYKDALKVVEYYKLRWQVEEFFKVLKNGGCKVEKSCLRSFERLVRHLSTITVISWRIHYLQHIARSDVEALAIDYVDQGEIEAISLHHFKKCVGTIYNWKLNHFLDLVAQLGGHTIKKGKNPGLTSIYRGLIKVEDKAKTVLDIKESFGFDRNKKYSEICG